MNKERLTILAEHLEKLELTPKTKRKRIFKMDAGWFDKPEKDNCGTVACAGGEATTIPAFRKLGLKRAFDGTPEFEGEQGHTAMQEFFEISSETSQQIFYSNNYKTI